MGVLRTDRVSGLGGGNAIKGSVEMRGAQNMRLEIVDGNADVNLGSSDFTIECWYNPGGTTGTSNSLDVDLLMLWNNTNNRRSYGLYRDSSGYLGLIGSSDGTNSDMQSYHSYNFSDVNAWYHIAAVRISNTATIYVNGAVLGSATVSGSFYTNTVDNLVVGGQLAGTSYDSKIARGFISNMRLIIGDGIYTGAFTPPANELTVTPNTKLLCCQSPGNILQEATGKTLVAYRSSVNDSFAKASTFAPDKGEDHGTTFGENTVFDTLSYMVPPGGRTRDRYLKSTGDIVSGNLIWHIDAGNPTSYAGVTTSGTTIYDLQGGTGVSAVGIATLTSGHSSYPAPGWTPDAGGAWYLGSDSDLDSPSNVGQEIVMPQYSLGNDNYTINVWIKLQYYSEQSDGFSYIISHNEGGPVSFHAHVKEVSGKGRIGAGAYYTGWTYDYAKDVDYNTVIGLNKWYMLTWVNTAQYTQSMYVNGVIQKLHNANDNTWNSRSSNGSPVNSTAYAGNETTNAWIGQIQYYNDTLTEDEILQNYNAHKCRYDQ